MRWGSFQETGQATKQKECGCKLFGECGVCAMT